jgi:hypothetical protein
MPELERKNKVFTVFSRNRKDEKASASGSLAFEECFNFTVRGSALEAEIGCEIAWNNPIKGYYDLTSMCVYSHPEKGKGVAFTVADEVNFAYGDTGKEPLFWGEYELTEPVMVAHSAVDGGQFLLLGAQEGVYVYCDGALRLVDSIPDCKAAVWCNERVFVLGCKEKNRIYYSAYSENAPAYMTNVEYLDLEPNDGEVEGMAVNSGMVWLLRENKLTKIKTNEWEDGFVTEDFSASFGKAVAGSLCACGGDLVFAAEDGLYIADDGDVEKVLFADFSGVSKGCSGTFGRYYFFSYAGEEGERTLFYCPDTEEYAWADFGVYAPAADGEECYFYREGALCKLNRKSKLCKKTLKKVWKSVSTDFSMGTGRKLLRSVVLRGKGKFVLSVATNSGMGGTYAVDLTSGEGRADVLLKGEKFSLTLESEDEDCRIDGMDVEADVYERGGLA